MSNAAQQKLQATLLEKIAEQASAQVPNIMGYDAVRCDNVKPWAWPIDSNGIRVTPEELQGYRAHLFRLPCCLCVMLKAKRDVREYTESEVYLSKHWESFGEYMLGCASPEMKCGYEINLEKPYSTPGLRTLHYTCCDSNTKKQKLNVPEVPLDMEEEQAARHEKLVKLIGRLKKQKDAKIPYVLEFIAELQDLRPWSWPIDSDGIRVTPTELQGYRAHLFRLPCCLCAVPLTKGESLRYTTSQIYVSETWEFLGEYMLGCANQGQKCGYEGVEEQPSKVKAMALLDIEKLAPTQIEDARQKLNRLDARLNPGVSSTEFYQLFVTCRECDQFMARRVFKYHRCTAINPEAVPASYEDEE
ncbi:hypothetical protein DXG01_016124 [Tephrocybe rancida]|nr:hypothetical protein DXG01_016124 [Tephrocybe rancida]